MTEYHPIFLPYNPWWNGGNTLLKHLPQFQRPIFHELYDGIKTLPQILSITGPRRIGKSTLLLQLIQRLLQDGIKPSKLLYYSFDDPSLIAKKIHPETLIEQLMQKARRDEDGGVTYLFFDEIQRLDHWELFVKKYHDLQYPIKLILSGSASSPIFRKSSESLLGRIKNYQLLPFSFREFVLYASARFPDIASELFTISESGQIARDLFIDASANSEKYESLRLPSIALMQFLDEQMQLYFLEGGFPEVWNLPSWTYKQEYLYDNQIKKVIYEDLVLAAEFRKPELLKRFYISLLEMPGREINMLSVANETDIKVSQIEKYLPLLEMTDLVYRISKYRSGALRVRKGLMKFYLVDLALRNAVLLLHEESSFSPSTLGLYAENLVFLALKKWKRTIQMDYYRERGYEVDFIVHSSSRGLLPIEVKYQNELHPSDYSGLIKFRTKFKSALFPIIVSKQWKDFGKKDSAFLLPLPLFLLLFD